MSELKYYYDDYINDVSALVDRYKNIKNPHVVGIYKNSLPAAVHVSNALRCPLSIIKVENDTARWLIDYVNDKSIRPKDCPFFPRLIVIDTIYDSGNQFKAIKQMPEFIKNPDYTFFSFFGCENDYNVYYVHEQVYRNIVFPWHLTKQNSNLKLSV